MPKDQQKVYDRCGDRWEFVITFSEGQFQQAGALISGMTSVDVAISAADLVILMVGNEPRTDEVSFVNSINTIKGPALSPLDGGGTSQVART